ncbi:MAG: sugar transferase, partial [Tannerella sp.]|nr:sugar transferase [Tannerella sp.]
MKRSFDILFSVVALLIFSFPMMLIIALIKVREKHPVLFRQERIGKNKKPFNILKFQTMVEGVPTKTGRILRKTGLDELPQFINVLKGDMNIVGPRALLHSDIDRLGWNDDFHEMRWSIKPGITGFAQIYGGQHCKSSWFWDRFYIFHNNVCVDFKIVLISFL